MVVHRSGAVVPGYNFIKVKKTPSKIQKNILVPNHPIFWFLKVPEHPKLPVLPSVMLWVLLGLPVPCIGSMA